jgi:protocatechuate 3,4-dioxygenase beta subunit
MRMTSIFAGAEAATSEAPSRRSLLLSGGATLATIGLSAPPVLIAARLMPTPAQTEGPYYPQALPQDTDADLLRFAGAAGPPEGAPTLVSGRVLDTGGRPIAGARVEIWQCDAHGRYHHVARESGPRPPDPNFQGFGRVMTDAEGRYAFQTIRPVPYPGRTPHIHYNVVAPDRRRLITQLYVEGEAGNATDFALQGVRNAQARAMLIRPFRPAPEAGLGPRGLSATFDIVLAG